ncbi:hypothetical protein D3C76_1427000 [compost metagenome]
MNSGEAANRIIFGKDLFELAEFNPGVQSACKSDQSFTHGGSLFSEISRGSLNMDELVDQSYPPCILVICCGIDAFNGHTFKTNNAGMQLTTHE